MGQVKPEFMEFVQTFDGSLLLSYKMLFMELLPETL